MAELGIAASVVQLADFGLRLSVKLYTFSEAVASAPATVKEISTEVSLTSSVLKSLGDNLARDKQLRLCSQHAIESTEKTVTECLRVFSELDDALTKSMTKMGLVEGAGKKHSKGVAALERLKWPFLQPKMQLLRSNLDRLKASLTLMLEVLNYARQVTERTESPDALQTQRAIVEALAQSNQEYAKKFEVMQKAIEDNQAKQAENSRGTAQGAHDPPPAYLRQNLAVMTDGSTVGSTSRDPPGPPPPPPPSFLPHRPPPPPPPELLTTTSRQDLAIEGVAEELAHYCRLLNTMFEEVDSTQYKLEQETRMRIREDVRNTHLRESRILARRHDVLDIVKAIGSMKTLKSVHWGGLDTAFAPPLTLFGLSGPPREAATANFSGGLGELGEEMPTPTLGTDLEDDSSHLETIADNKPSELGQKPAEKPAEITSSTPIRSGKTGTHMTAVKMPIPTYGVKKSWQREEKALLKNVTHSERQLETKKTTLGDEHPETLYEMNRLARYYACLGWTEKSLAMKERELEIRKKETGRMPPNWRQAIERIAAEAVRRREEDAEAGSEPGEELCKLADALDPREKVLARRIEYLIMADDSEPEEPPVRDDPPVYVNSKQYHRIVKRREARKKIEDALRRMPGSKRLPYLHGSRHEEAVRRPRGPGGRFLTAEEVAQLDSAAGETQQVGGAVPAEAGEEGEPMERPSYYERPRLRVDTSSLPHSPSSQERPDGAESSPAGEEPERSISCGISSIPRETHSGFYQHDRADSPDSPEYSVNSPSPYSPVNLVELMRRAERTNAVRGSPSASDASDSAESRGEGDVVDELLCLMTTLTRSDMEGAAKTAGDSMGL